MIDTIIKGDCLAEMKALPSGMVDLVITDPPYMIETTGGGFVGRRQYTEELAEIKDGFSVEILDELCRVMKRINCYLFCSQKQIIPLLKYFVEERNCNFNILSWHKTNPVPACGNKYLTDTEFILFFREKGVPVYGSIKTKSTYFTTPLNTSDKRLWGHPTIKPLSIIETLMINSSQEGDLILDPFMGSGTTAIACMRQKRHYLGYEINEEYYQTIQKRILQQKTELQLF